MTARERFFYFIYLHRTGLTVTALSVMLLVWPLVESNPYNLGLSNLIAIYAIVVLGLNLFIGYAGQISLGHAAFFAIGAYGSAIGTTTLGGPAWPVMMAVALLAALVALAVGLPALKLSGHYLAMATLGFNIVVYTLLVQWDAVTGGPSGFFGHPLPAYRSGGVRQRNPFALPGVDRYRDCPSAVSQSGAQRCGPGPGGPGRG